MIPARSIRALEPPEGSGLMAREAHAAPERRSNISFNATRGGAAFITIYRGVDWVLLARAR
jgi:hypothetical protein